MTEYVKVPREPTEAMLANGREALLPLVRLDSYGPLIGLWQDMLAASPPQPDTMPGDLTVRCMSELPQSAPEGVIAYLFDPSRSEDALPGAERGGA